MGHERWSGRMRRLHGRPGSHGGVCNDELDPTCTRQAQKHLRRMIVCLGPLRVLPRILSRVQTMVADVSSLLPPIPPPARHPLNRIGAERNSPFFRRSHRIDIASVEMPVPGNRSDSENAGAGWEGVVLPGRASSLGRGARRRGRALYHPMRQPSIQLKQESL